MWHNPREDDARLDKARLVRDVVIPLHAHFDVFLRTESCHAEIKRESVRKVVLFCTWIRNVNVLEFDVKADVGRVVRPQMVAADRRDNSLEGRKVAELRCENLFYAGAVRNPAQYLPV